MRVDTLQQEAGNSALLRLLKATPQAEPYLRAEEPLERYLYEQYAQDLKILVVTRACKGVNKNRAGNHRSRN